MVPDAQRLKCKLGLMPARVCALRPRIDIGGGGGRPSDGHLIGARCEPGCAAEDRRAAKVTRRDKGKELISS
ncbi:unnamed protein product [Heligmosomoides polygyrus]|uniref:Uncharacterized protein n=1 Tax=Heligmosomoides polygyrus TaxID=6339 RepID=A0A183FMR5_HELPZ|nr:unnamed protein product [Heligmosomoides polygyrus]